MDEETGITGWVLAAITTIGGILSGVIAMLYKTQIADYKLMIAELKAKVETLEKHADACEKAYGELRVQHAVLAQRVSDLESSKASHQTVQRKIDELKQ